MRTRGSIAVVAAGLALVLSACGTVSGTAKAVASGQSAAPSPSAQPTMPTTTGLSFQYTVASTVTERDDAHILRKYPHYTISADQGALPAGVATAAVTVLNTSVTATVSDFESTGYHNGYQDIFAQGQKWQIAVAAGKPIRADSLLTITYTANESFGGETDEEPTALTIDMTTGQQIGLAQLFTGGDTSQLQQVVTAALQDRAKTDSPAGQSPTPIVAEDVTDILNNGRWYPDYDGLHILVPTGVVDPVANGAIEVTIPWPNLHDITTTFTQSTWRA